MSNATYVERLTTYIQELPTDTKNDLLRKLALLVFTESSAETLSAMSAFYHGVRQLLAPFHPDEHLRFNRAALSLAIGECVAAWWGEALRRPLTGRELDQIFFHEIPASGIREALQRLGTAWAARKDES